MDRISMFKYKQVADVPWSWSTLWSGDCIYIPAGNSSHVHITGTCIVTMISRVLHRCPKQIEEQIVRVTVHK